MKAGWKRVKLGEIAIGKGSYGIAAPAVEYDPSLPTYLRITDINDDGSINVVGLKSVDAPDASEYYLKPNDLVIARTGASTGRSYFYDGRDGRLVYAGFLIKFSLDDKKVWPRFIKYHCLSPTYKGWVSQFMSGSTRGNINAVTLGKMNIDLPPLPTQRRIAAVLGALDDKIELNRKMNANLEAQAQALFKSWFVDFAPFGGKMPKGWKMGTLGEITSRMGTGLNPRRNFVLGQGRNFYVTIKNMGNNRIYLDDRCDKIDDDAIALINKRSDLRAGDVLFSGIGTIGRTYLITQTPKNWNTSESVFNLRPIVGVSSEYLYLLMLSDAMQGFVQEYAQGSAQKGIRMAELKRYKCVVPTTKAMCDFTSIVNPIIQKVARNNDEIDRLAETRDALLPKLMSGELEVA